LEKEGKNGAMVKTLGCSRGFAKINVGFKIFLTIPRRVRGKKKKKERVYRRKIEGFLVQKRGKAIKADPK